MRDVLKNVMDGGECEVSDVVGGVIVEYWK